MTKLVNTVKQWWWLVAMIFTAGGTFYTLRADVGSLKKSSDKHTEQIEKINEFVAKQSVFNENVNSMDKKIDRLLRR